MVHNYTKAPRLYGQYALEIGTSITLNPDHCHYLLSVMRRDNGDTIRIFNEKYGEFAGKIIKKSKKIAYLDVFEQIKCAKKQETTKNLYFSPIKKDRLSILIEKCVELGVTDLHPVITDHTENRKFNADKAQKQIIEATEQCERLDIATLHPMIKIDDVPHIDAPIHCAMERYDAQLFGVQVTAGSNYSCLVGPEGGWSAREIDLLSNAPNIIAVSLGDTILRAETAAMCMLARLL